MSFKDYLNRYPSYHQHPTNKKLHLIGVPLIILGILLLLTRFWVTSAACLVVGMVLLGIGHRLEGNKPAAASNPLYILAAPIWVGKELWQGIREFFSPPPKP